jgi:hypothetical protein
MCSVTSENILKVKRKNVFIMIKKNILSIKVIKKKKKKIFFIFLIN